MKKLLSVLLIALFCFLLEGCNIQQPNTNDNDENLTATVGQALTYEGIEITFDKVEHYVDTSVILIKDIPAKDKMFILLWFTAKNTTDKDTHLNMFYETSFCDGTPITDVSVLFNVEGESIFGDIPAGKSRTGYIAYEVSEDWNTIEFNYQAVLSDKKITFIAKKTDI